jgi:transcriptional regulator of acetoin/glycerol metabolism
MHGRPGSLLGNHLIRRHGAGLLTDEQVCRRALERTGGRVALAARQLGYVHRSALWYHLNRLGLGRLPGQLRDRQRELLRLE